MATPNSEACHYGTLASSQRLAELCQDVYRLFTSTFGETIIPGGFPTICV